MLVPSLVEFPTHSCDYTPSLASAAEAKTADEAGVPRSSCPECFVSIECLVGEAGADGEAGAEMALVVVCARTSPVRCGRWYCNIGAPQAQARRANVM